MKYKIHCSVSVIAVLLANAILCSNANARQQNEISLPDGVEKVTEVEGISEFKLSNGVQVLLFPDASKPQFTINVTVLVGSRHEGYGETGMAHLLEHMLFKGTSRHDDIPTLLKDRGVLNMNGTTSFDRTNYYETLPEGDENLKFAIDMESDRLMNSLIRGEDLASEMTVVRSEFERSENSPQAILMQRIMANAYEWHNYGKTTIGNRTDIMRVPVKNLREFYRKYYQPDNLMVVLAGKFDQAKGLEYLEKHFGAIELPKRELPKTYTEEPPQDGERIVLLRRTGDTKYVGAAYHVTAAGHPDYPATQVLASILSNVPSGPLYESMVESELASSASAFVRAGYDPGVILAMAEVSEDGDLDKAQEQFLNTLENLSEEQITDEAVKRAVTKSLKDRELQFANSERVALNLSEWRAYGDWRLYFLHRDRLEKVTKDDVLRVAKKMLISSNRTLGRFEPTDSPVRADVPVTPDLSKALAGYKGRAKIAEGEVFEPLPELIEKRTVRGTLKSGIKYALLSKKTRGEIVNVTGEINYGDEENLKGRTTATRMLPTLLSRGTSEYSFQEYRDKLDELKARLNFGGANGTVSFSIQTKRENLSATLDLMKQALRTPLLDAEELDVVRRQMVTRMESQKSDPQGLAGSEFRRKLAPYPKDDVRYSPSIEESIERMSKVSIDEIKELHSQFLNGTNGALVVVGDFDADTVVSKLEPIFADWNSDKKYARIEEPAIPGVKGERVVINTPDKQNAIYLAGTTFAIDDSNVDYEPLLIGNYVLGGGPLSSRLADRVRKQDGLSYGVGSQFIASDQDESAMMMMFAISNPTNTEKVVDAIDEEVTRFIESGVTSDELEKAKKSYLKNRRGRRAVDRNLARILLTNLKNDRTMSFQQESDERIEALGKPQIDEAVKRHFKKENLVIVTAGDFEKAKAEEAQEKDDSESEDSK